VTNEAPKDLATSIRQRLYNLSLKENRDFNLVLTAFATERLLYRIGSSNYARHFVLKGARLFALWSDKPQRPTRDLDLLGYGDPSADTLRETFRALCRAKVTPDGLAFDENTVSVEEIRASKEYDGQRVKMTVHLAQARIPLQIDVGFGDTVTPAAQLTDYTALLDGLPVPQVLAYPRETVIAEKLHAIITLDTMNTRMKDFYDLASLAEEYSYDGPLLCRAIRATFDRRNTPIPREVPDCLRTPFALDADRQRLWVAFLTRGGIGQQSNMDFAGTHAKIHAFLAAPMIAAVHDGDTAFPKEWHPKIGWVPLSQD